MSAIAPASTKEDILQYLLKQGSASAQEIAGTLGISPQAVRRHLKDLEEAKLIDHNPIGGGMGRPQYIYSLSNSGKKHFPKGYKEFSVSLLQSLVKNIGTETVQELLKQQWQEKAQIYSAQIGNLSVEERLAKLAELRRSEGYVTEWFSQPEGYIYTEYNCVIADVANSFPTVCAHELGMFSAIFAGYKVDRIHWMIRGEHCCGYSIGSTLSSPQS